MELTKLYSTSDLILLKLAIYFFRILGLAPLKVINVNQVPIFYRTRMGSYYCYFLILLFSGLLFSTMPSILNTNYANRNYLTVIFDVARGTHGTVTSFITWIFISLQAEQIANIMNRIVDIDISINNLGMCERKSTRYLSVFLIIMNIFIWIILIFLDKYSYEVGWMTLAIIEIGAAIPLFIVNWFLIEYTLFLIIIKSRFDRVNCALATIIHSSNDFVFQTTSISRFFLDDSNVVNIREVKKINTKLYEVSSEILDLLEVPLLLEIIFLWGSIVFSFYYLAIPWISSSGESRSLVVYADSAIWLSMEFFPLMAMVNATSGVEEKMRETSNLVQKNLSWSITRREIKSELKKFSLELFHRDVKFNACGLLALDCTIIKSICSSVVSYLFILAQIHVASLHMNSFADSGT